MTGNELQKYRYIRMLEDLTGKDSVIVGVKNAALGEMARFLKDQGILFPIGYATTSEAYWELLRANDMKPKIRLLLEELNRRKIPLEQAGASIRELFLHAEFPERLSREILSAYDALCKQTHRKHAEVAVRSSATAEDLPEASFAGMLETSLNVSGKTALMNACRRCYASLFTDRAIFYREKKGFDHKSISLSIGIQQMVRSDRAGAGVMFSIDCKTNFPDLVVITAAWGLGESVVQGTVIPDEYRVFKPLLRKENCIPIVEKTLGNKEKMKVYAEGRKGGTIDVDVSDEDRTSFVLADEEILKLARWACAIEGHYGKAMDMEWAKDGDTNALYIVQARPVTTQPKTAPDSITVSRLKEEGELLLNGVGVGDGIAAGPVSLIGSYKEIDQLAESAILVSEMANTGWITAIRLKDAKGLVTDFGGRNSHGAIVCRELNLPGILGTRAATSVLEPGREITISAAEGDYGLVYDGILEYETEAVRLHEIPETRMRFFMSVASDAAAFQWWRLPCDGIGLVRMDFIFGRIIQAHPMALIHFDQVKSEDERRVIQSLTRRYRDKPAYFIDKLSTCIAEIASSRYPAPTIVRFSDFETRNYAVLQGGRRFEPKKLDRAHHYRGVSRYLSDHYGAAFELECRAILEARDMKGFKNIHVMIPYCRDADAAERILGRLEENGLKRGKEGLQVHLSCDFPSNVTDATVHARLFDGFSVSARKLYPLASGAGLSVDESMSEKRRGDAMVADVLDRLTQAAHASACAVTVRGETLRRHQSLIHLFVEAGVDGISLAPHGIPSVKRAVAEFERKHGL
jgi:pyruvate,water dikinase